MNCYPEEFAAALKHLAEEEREFTEARARGDEGEAQRRASIMQDIKGQLESMGVLNEGACQQILDMAFSASAVVLCEAHGWDGLEDRRQELVDAFNPQPEELAPSPWNRTREMFLAAARMACAEVRGDRASMERECRVYDRHARSVAGFGTVASGRGPQDREAYVSKAEQLIPATVIMFSGCQDSQTSADVYSTSAFGLPSDAGPGGAGGACTNSMIKALNERGDYTWVELLERMRSILRGKYTQIPMLSSSRSIDLKSPFRVQNENPSGRCRALLIGINYVGSKSELRGCHNDVETMRRYLHRNGYSQSDMRILMDDGSHEAPTKANIEQAFLWLSKGAAEGDSLFFHYSGHGASVKDDDGDEEDGMDECLVPVDFQSAGLIRDDEVYKLLVGPLQAGVQLTCVLDCCHSGTIMDLPFMFKANDEGLQAVAMGHFSLMQENPNFDFGKLLQVIKDHPGLCVAAAAVGGAIFFLNGPEKTKKIASTLVQVAQSDNPAAALVGAAGGLMKCFFGR